MYLKQSKSHWVEPRIEIIFVEPLLLCATILAHDVSYSSSIC